MEHILVTCEAFFEMKDLFTKMKDLSHFTTYKMKDYFTLPPLLDLTIKILKLVVDINTRRRAGIGRQASPIPARD